MKNDARIGCVDEKTAGEFSKAFWGRLTFKAGRVHAYKLLASVAVLIAAVNPLAARGQNVDLECVKAQYGRANDERFAFWALVEQTSVGNRELAPQLQMWLNYQRLIARLRIYTFNYLIEHEPSRLQLDKSLFQWVPGWGDCEDGPLCTNPLYEKLKSEPGFKPLYEEWESARKAARAAPPRTGLPEEMRQLFGSSAARKVQAWDKTPKQLGCAGPPVISD